jgi:DNA-binding SARP family transcriptional activator
LNADGEPIVSARIRVPPPSGLRRPRLNSLVDASWQVPLTVVVAPAGSGKTTTLAMFAQPEGGANRVVAWYQAGLSEGDPARFLNYLEGTVRQVVPSVPAGWRSVDKAAAALETVARPLAIVIDDAHTLLSTAAEGALEQLVGYLPPQAHVILAGRHPPAFDLPRWRLAGQVVEIGPDDLRFRSWEVEELFALHYGVRLVPEEVAELARRTGGWAAGLSLFQLATANRSSSERRGMLASMSSRLLDIRDYLTRNVLATLEADQQEFLVGTCVLGRLSGPWCDELLKTSGSARRLDDLARRHLFLVSHDGGHTYQEHEVLRSFLEELLLDQVGEPGVRALYAEAGTILEGGGAVSEALRCYCRAQDWGAADRLLGLSGDRVVDPLGPWGDALPPAVVDHDAWYLLAMARRQVRSGHWDAALESYRRAEQMAGGVLVRRTCQRERFQLAGWMDPATTMPHEWTGALRRALARNPLTVVDGAMAPSSGGRLARGLAALAAGHVVRAHSILADEEDGPGGTSNIRRWAEVALFFTARLSGRPYSAAALQTSLDGIDAHVPPWLGRLLHAAAGPPATFVEHLEASRGEAMATENPWADLVFGLLEGCSLLGAGRGQDAVPRFDRAAAAASRLGAPVVAAWAAAAASLGALGTDPKSALRRAVSADQLARSVGCPGASALSLLVEAAAGDDPGWREVTAGLEQEGVISMAALVARARTSGSSATAGATEAGGPAAAPVRAPVLLAEAIAVEAIAVEAIAVEAIAVEAIAVEAMAAGTMVAAAEGGAAPGTVEVCCLGPFVLTVSGRPVDTGPARPRVRALLHYLAMQAGEYVHRDAVCAALWSIDEASGAKHSLQVAVSALRQFLETQAGPGAGALIGRRGTSYVLDIGDGAHDLAQMAAKVHHARRARLEGRNEDAVPALRAGIALYRGDLLAEAGTAEWVLGPRERYRLMASDASQLLAAALLDLGDPAGAAAAASWGLAIDRYCDGLWKLMIAAHDLGSNQAASARTRNDYRRVLAELGVGQSGP